MKRVCFMCGKELESDKFTDDSFYYEHVVCNSCRKFMDERLNYLTECDRQFHKDKKRDYEITKAYLRKLNLYEDSLCEEVDEFGFRCQQKKMKGKKYCYYHNKMHRSKFLDVNDIEEEMYDDVSVS